MLFLYIVLKFIKIHLQIKLGSSFTQLHTPFYQVPNFTPGNSRLSNCQPFHTVAQSMAHFTMVKWWRGPCLQTGKEWLIQGVQTTVVYIYLTSLLFKIDGLVFVTGLLCVFHLYSCLTFLDPFIASATHLDTCMNIGPCCPRECCRTSG